MVAFNPCSCLLEHLTIKNYLKLHYSKEETSLLITTNLGVKLFKSYCTETTKQKVEDHLNFLLQEKW